MILVTGTQRSGTSMWMQILAAAGLEVIGERFPRNWGEHLTAANPDGFYESEFVAGVYFRTNPHPVSGVFLFPEQTNYHAVKVFIPGLIRTDLAYIDRVIATVRSWRTFARSRARLRAIVRDAHKLPDEVSSLPPGLEWWADNFALIRDIATRRYPVHVQSYESLIADPEASIHAVIKWLGVGDARAACAVVHRERSGVVEQGEIEGSGLEPRHIEVIDDFYHYIHRGKDLNQPLIERLNVIDRELRPRLIEHNASVKAAAIDALIVERNASPVVR